MTTKEIAAAAGCSTVYVREAARQEHIVPRFAVGANGGKVLDWDASIIPVIRARKHRGQKHQLQRQPGNAEWSQADAPRHICHSYHDQHGDPIECVLPQIGHSCTRCPRVTRYDEVSAVVCDVMADIEHLAEVR